MTVDVRLRGDRIGEIAPRLAPEPGEQRLDASGGCLLPGLHDHHLHLMALAASLDSVSCGPPDIATEDQLATLLRELNTAHDSLWVRGIGYHPCVAGDIDRTWLDQHIPDRPIRIQHRGGRLWVLNSAALQALAGAAEASPHGMEYEAGQPTGRLYEEDGWLRRQLPRALPDIARASLQLAACGVTGITDTTPANGPAEWQLFTQLQQQGQLLQRVRMMGSTAIQTCLESPMLRRGELKIHLLESQLPNWDDTIRSIGDAHSAGRSVAIHCVTRTELVFALGALEEAGTHSGDRIEHASICPPELLQKIARLGLRVVTQPHFLSERGDQYLEDVDEHDRPWLYRGVAFLESGVPLAAGSDAPFGGADLWESMRSATRRTTLSGQVIGADEVLTPEQALQLFLSSPGQPGLGARELSVGAAADLCLLDAPWESVRENLCREHVRATWVAGRQVFSSG